MTTKIVQGKEYDFSESCLFVETLAGALQKYGVSSNSMQKVLAGTVKALKMNGEFLLTLNDVQTILWNENEQQQRIHIFKIRSGNYDLGKLKEIMDIARQVNNAQLQPNAGSQLISEIVNVPTVQSPWYIASSYFFCGVSFGFLLGISWLNVLFGGILSLVSFLMVRLLTRNTGYAALLEFIVVLIDVIVAVFIAMIISGIKSSTYGFINTYYKLNKYVNMGVEWIYTEKVNHNGGVLNNNRFQFGIQIF